MSGAAEILEASDLAFLAFLAFGVLASIACAITAAWAIVLSLSKRESEIAVVKIVPLAMLVELVALVAAPLLVWLDANASAMRFGADSMVTLFVAPSLRAIGPGALALALVNGVVIALLRAAR
ncbi:MAG TPA: hypothetical protein VF407_00970 [Polyangiaceae bacterium]